MKIVLPLPPTDNHTYGQRGKIRFMYKEASDWKQDAGLIAKSAGIKYTEENVVVGEIHFYLKFDRDIQGSLKILFDSLEGIYYKNDKQVKQFGSVFKHKDKNNPRIEITINENIKKEKWRAITGHKDYMVSDKGRVKSLKYKKELILNHGTIRGYHKVVLVTNKKNHNAIVSRLVAQEFIPLKNYNVFTSYPKCLSVNHKDGNKDNNSVENLEWMTAKQNTAHAIKNGFLNHKNGRFCSGISKLQ